MREGKTQLIFSGKAHPRDDEGKRIIRDLVMMNRKYKDAVVFLENNNMEIARLMVRGCDVWLNNPVWPLEASGTSGMKAAMNGVLNLSVVDGWVGEGPQHGVSGWLLDAHYSASDPHLQNSNDLDTLYRKYLAGEWKIQKLWRGFWQVADSKIWIASLVPMAVGGSLAY